MLQHVLCKGCVVARRENRFLCPCKLKKRGGAEGKSSAVCYRLHKLPIWAAFSSVLSSLAFLCLFLLFAALLSALLSSSLSPLFFRCPISPNYFVFSTYRAHGTCVACFCCVGRKGCSVHVKALRVEHICACA